MNDSLVDKIAQAVLYEGYILYPYRASSRKNQERFTFGRVYPQSYSEAQHGLEPCLMQTQCLVRKAGPGASVGGRVRFLHAMAREICDASVAEDPEHSPVVAELRVDGRTFQTWHESVERSLTLPEMPLDASYRRTVPFSFPASRTVEPLRDDGERVVGLVRRIQHALDGELDVAIETLSVDLARVTVRLTNATPLNEQKLADAGAVLLATFASTHLILEATGAGFISLTDPPPEYADEVAACKNIGAWPVLVGDEQRGESGTLLASPIILSDYPQIAPESPGDLCDGLEIDEILTLRVMTMTEEEKREMRGVDEYARRILERTESLRKDDLMKMHGTMRDIAFPVDDFFGEQQTRLESISVRGVSLQSGDRVRIAPKKRADAMDLMLAGKIGMIEAIEQDAEGCIHLALVLEEDPGRDLGMTRQPGHRFFYTPEEIEPLA